jgi:hypothetical protein
VEPAGWGETNTDFEDLLCPLPVSIDVIQLLSCLAPLQIVLKRHPLFFQNLG